MTTFTKTLKNFLFEETSASSPRGPSTEAPRDCVLVIDVSGSMLEDDWKPTRLDGAKEAAITFARRLLQEQPNARVAIVVFACKAKLACEITTVSGSSKIGQKIDQTDVGGSTNMYAGLKVALGLFGNHGRTCQVVLLTDGHNTGKNPEKLAERLKEFAIIECVGIGGSPGDVDESLLKQIASSQPDGRKRYRWIGQKDQLVKHFHKLAGGIRRVQR